MRRQAHADPWHWLAAGTPPGVDLAPIANLGIAGTVLLVLGWFTWRIFTETRLELKASHQREIARGDRLEEDLRAERAERRAERERHAAEIRQLQDEKLDTVKLTIPLMESGNRLIQEAMTLIRDDQHARELDRARRGDR